MQQQAEQVREHVRRRYAEIARGGTSCCDSSCCGPAEKATTTLPENADDAAARTLAVGYSAAELEAVPEGAVTGLGCGNPVALAELRPGDVVLDLGSGAGLDALLAAREVGEQGRVIGVDMTPEMLARAERNREKLGLANVEFRRGQIEALPVEDGTVDLILSNCVINLSPDKPAVFREAYRVLKPGGRLSVSDIVTDRPFSEVMAADADSWAACVAGAIPLDEYIGMLADAGFEGIEATDKVAATEIVDEVEGGPRLFSARITAVKPLG